MEYQIFIIFSFLFLLSSAVLPAEAGGDGKVRLLFVFGDSYADTGNSPVSVSTAWKKPYGVTFPGKPSGRFSDGRVLTDYIATSLGISSPLPYQVMKNSSKKRNGINFAHGGTGVFTTLQSDQPNMTTQIDFFEQLIHKNVYTTLDLGSSVALVSLAGNDYATFLAKNGSFQGLPEFTRLVINQLMLNVRRIKRLGINKIVLTAMGPLGCLPQIAASNSYQNCNAAQNNFSQAHNQMLKENIWRLNYEAAAPILLYLDLYTAFISAMKLEENPPGNLLRKLKPCCIGECGLVDKDGKKKYSVCENPRYSFFWDSIHPSNSGWAAVYSALNVSFRSLLV